MRLDLRFGEEDWQRIEEAWAAWWRGELDRPLVVVEGLDPLRADDLDVPALTAHLPMDMAPSAVLERYERRLEATHYYGDSWPRWRPNFGPAVVAGFLGARAHVAPNTVWYEPVEEVDIHDLHLVYDPNNRLWLRVKELMRSAVERWQGQVCVGFPDLVSNLDVVGTLLTPQQLLLDLYDAPDQIERLMAQMTELWCRYFDELYAIVKPAGRGSTPWAPIWSPGRCYMLQSDFSYAISPSMFERFVAPDLEACAQVLDHAFYHMDGKGQIPHLEQVLRMENVRGVQWIPGDGAPPPEEWIPLLKRIRDAGKLCQLYVSPEGALTITRELGGRGFAFYVEQSMSESDAHALLEALWGKQG